jgi:hypothetical protein
VCCRFYNGEKFEEELLSLIALDGDTTGLSAYNALISKLDDLGLPLSKCVSITTDGAPSMVGREQGLVARLRKDKPSLLGFHCVIHQSVLCGKLSEELKELMTNMMKLINYLKAKSALRHRKLRGFLEEIGADHTDLLTHNNVRWLSKGTALARIWELREELTAFLDTCGISAQPHLDIMRSIRDMANIAFLVDMFGHLNLLNLKLQGKGKSILELWSAVKSFIIKLEVFEQDLKENMNHFPHLKDFVVDWEHGVQPNQYTSFISKIREEFEVRFSQFRDVEKLSDLIKNPMRAQPDGNWRNDVTGNGISDRVTIPAIQLELCDLKSTETEAILADIETFWCSNYTAEKYPQLTKMARSCLTIYASTYLCESVFSNMNHIKNKFRSKLSQQHLHQLLRVSCTHLNPDYEAIMAGKSVFHLSH